MSKLEELIKELCPDGVKNVVLNTICNIYDGTHQTPKYTDSGVKFASVENIRDLYATKKYISESDYDIKYKIKPQLGDLLMTRIGSIGRCAVIEKDEPLAYYVSLALLRPDKSKVNSKFLKYAIEGLHGRKELYKRTLITAVPIKINMGDIGKIKISIPPLEIQQEIVQILDNLTDSTEKLKIKLQEELTARKKQYEYYREELLAFRKHNVNWITLGEIGPVCMCKRIMKAQTNANGEVPFYKIGTFGKEANAYISKEIYEKYKNTYKFPKKGDILISAAGTIGRTIVYNGEPAYFQDSNIVWIDNDESKVSNKFLIYCYAMNPWAISTGGTIARLYNSNISNARIPAPSLEIQEKIVSIIEKIDLIYSQIIKKILDEIEARQKQYEYYRDKLLSFKELKKEGV